LIVGVAAALAVRLVIPATLLRFGFDADPANAIIVATLLIALLLLAAGVLLRWQSAHTQRALAAQASAEETERRRFIQRLDHELKNPLTAIQVHLDNLQASEDKSKETIAEVRAQADRLAQLTRGLRRLADLGLRPLEIERVEIGELLDEVVELLQAPDSAQAADSAWVADRITLDVQKVPWPIPPVEGDRELLLLMVFRNLADNALKYSPPSAGVQIRARHTSGALVVEVIDTGRGIPPDELPLVVEELYRGSNTRDVAGSGLGLSIVQRIVERHGGRLEIRSRPGQGTIATVQLPYDQTATR
jgi:two-component system OmpR family sensor kinase